MPYDPTDGLWDFGNLASNYNSDVQIFASGNDAQGAQRWIKPRGVSMVYMMAVSGGGGGGGGTTGATTTARGGGGGGACSSLGVLMKPAFLLPDYLLVQVGSGGLGGAAGQAGGNGTNSYISLGAGISAISVRGNWVLTPSAAASPPGGGGAGTSGAAGAAGGAPSLGTDGNIGHSAFGLTHFIVGVAGSAGGVQTGAVGADAFASGSGVPFGPGAGGAGVNSASTGFAGGNNPLTSSIDFSDGLLQPSAGNGSAGSNVLAGGNGANGLVCWKPFLFTGGGGGGSADGQIGGNGGQGGLGSGGGGGGGGTTGGKGGNGGDGIVIIISW
jgi:hypothetical protein